MATCVVFGAFGSTSCTSRAFCFFMAAMSALTRASKAFWRAVLSVCAVAFRGPPLGTPFDVTFGVANTKEEPSCVNPGLTGEAELGGVFDATPAGAWGGANSDAVAAYALLRLNAARTRPVASLMVGLSDMVFFNLELSNGIAAVVQKLVGQQRVHDLFKPAVAVQPAGNGHGVWGHKHDFSDVEHL